MPFDVEQSKLTRKEVVEIVAKFAGIKEEKLETIIGILIKLGVIPEYIFAEEKKS